MLKIIEGKNIYYTGIIREQKIIGCYRLQLPGQSQVFCFGTAAWCTSIPCWRDTAFRILCTGLRLNSHLVKTSQLLQSHRQKEIPVLGRHLKVFSRAPQASAATAPRRYCRYVEEHLEIKDKKLLFTTKPAIIDNFYLVSGHWKISAANNLFTTPAMVPISLPRVDTSTGRHWLFWG